MAQYNDPSSVDAAIKGHEGEVGAIIVEPMLGAGGGVGRPLSEALPSIRRIQPWRL